MSRLFGRAVLGATTLLTTLGLGVGVAGAAHASGYVPSPRPCWFGCGPSASIEAPPLQPWCPTLTVDGWGAGGDEWVEVDLWGGGNPTPITQWVQASPYWSNYGEFAVTFTTPPNPYNYSEMFWVTVEDAGGSGQSQTWQCIPG
jgi:hypothetical protein